VLDAKLEALADALIAKALEGDVGALREALHQLVGRPETVVSHEQDPDRPIRIVVESISARRREQLADLEAEDALVGRAPKVVSGDPERPIRVVVESISSRRREQLEDVEADDAEVEELPDEDVA
jgi:hypothetical protein